MCNYLLYLAMIIDEKLLATTKLLEFMPKWYSCLYFPTLRGRSFIIVL